MDLLLELAINFIKHVEAKQMVADYDLVTLFQRSFGDQLPVDHCAVCGREVSNLAAQDAGIRIPFSSEPGMKARGPGIVNANICFECAAQRDLIALKWNRHRQQLATQRNQCGTRFSLNGWYFRRTGTRLRIAGFVFVNVFACH